MTEQHRMDPPPRPVGGGEIRLSLPGVARYSRVARLALAGLASRSGLSYDDVEDVRIAVGELFNTLAAAETGSDALTTHPTITLVCRIRPESLEITASCEPGGTIEVTDLTEQILRAVVDEAAIDPNEPRIRVRKVLRDSR